MSLRTLAVRAVFVCLCSSAPALSAEEPERLWRPGLLGQLSLGRLHTSPEDPELDFGSLTRPGAGLSLERRLGERLALEARVAFVHKGARVGFASVGAREERVDTSIRYLTVPLLLKAYAGQGRLRPYLVAGPELAFRTSAHARYENAGVDTSLDVEEQLRGTDLALAFGLGFELRRGRGGLFAEALYSLGLENVARAHLEERLKTRTLQLNLGLRF